MQPVPGRVADALAPPQQGDEVVRTVGDALADRHDELVVLGQAGGGHGGGQVAANDHPVLALERLHHHRQGLEQLRALLLARLALSARMQVRRREVAELRSSGAQDRAGDQPEVGVGRRRRGVRVGAHPVRAAWPADARGTESPSRAGASRWRRIRTDRARLFGGCAHDSRKSVERAGKIHRPSPVMVRVAHGNRR